MKELLWDRIVSSPRSVLLGEYDLLKPHMVPEWALMVFAKGLHELRKAQVFRIDDVVRGMPNDLHMDDCVDCTPPFASTWIEYSSSAADSSLLDSKATDGILVFECRSTVDFLVANTPVQDHVGAELSRILSMDSAIYGILWFNGTPEATWAIPWITILCISKDGRLARLPFLLLLAGSQRVRDIMLDSGGAGTGIYVPPTFFSLLNCKNIVTVEEQRKKNQAARLAKKTGRPCDTYKTLRIKVGGELVRFPSADSSGEHKDQPLHRVRGHFKTYTQEKPLLGKLTGRYFWHPHVRGKEEFGRIHKRYRAVPADNDGGVS